MLRLKFILLLCLMISIFFIECKNPKEEQSKELISGQYWVENPDLYFGTDLSELSFTVENRGETYITWEYDIPVYKEPNSLFNTPCLWLSVQPNSGTLQGGETISIDVYIDRNLAPTNVYEIVILPIPSSVKSAVPDFDHYGVTAHVTIP